MGGGRALIVAIASQKGGVGKTTTTANLGAALAERGHPVTLVDFDPQGSLTVALGCDPLRLQKSIYDVLVGAVEMRDILLAINPKLALAPANIDLAGAEVELMNEIGRERVLQESLESIQPWFHYALIDCPPSLGLLTINALTAADVVLIPVQCHYLALRALPLLYRTIQKVRKRTNPRLRVLGILPTMLDTRTAHGREVLDELKRWHPKTLIDIPIRYRIGLADAAVSGQSILDYDPHGDLSEAYRTIAEVIDAKAQEHQWTRS